MRKFVVKDGTIVNIILADESFTIEGHELHFADGIDGEIGWPWVDGMPSKPEAPPPTEKEIRGKRDSLLSESDWTQLGDATVDKVAWAVYRQSLRDVPQQEGFPSDVVWPLPPT